MQRFLLQFFIILTIFILFAANPAAQTSLDSLKIVAFDPKPNQVDVDRDEPISIHFNQPVSALYFADMLTVYGMRSGKIAGTVALTDDDSTVVFTADESFLIGDRITAILARQDNPGMGILDKGFVWEFDIASRAGGVHFATTSYSTGIRLTAVVAVELDGDDKSDVVFAGSKGNVDILQVAYFRDNQLELGSSVVLPDRVRPLYAADLNADGLPDFVLIHRGRVKYSIPPRISICHMRPNGSLSLEETFTVDSVPDGKAEPRSATINDVNQDGFLDIIVLVKNEGSAQAAFVYLNDGTGHFEINPDDVHWFDAANNGESIFSRDLNGSGFIDIGVGHTSTAATVSLYANAGEAQYHRSADADLPAGNRDLELSTSIDVTGDLLPDVLAVDYLGSELLLYRNGGRQNSDPRMLPTFNFTSLPQVFSTIISPNWLGYGDIDADGDVDLAFTGSHQNSLRLLLNQAGEFNNIVNVPIPSNPISFDIGDLNGNGALDFLIGDTTGILTLVMNNVEGYSPPAAPVLLAPENNAVLATAVDFEWLTPGDADLDDQLHFRLTITPHDGQAIIYESSANPELFSPTPPVPQGQGSVRFTSPLSLNDGDYSWFVQAWDGLWWSEMSPEWRFTLDAAAPPAPLNIRANGANPSPWQAGQDFTVRWDLPPDDSGIKASFWKLATPPTSATDYDDTGAPGGPAVLIMGSDGVAPLYVWLADSAGNSDHRNTAQIDLRRDATAPSLNQLSVNQPAERFVDTNGQPWYNSKEDKNFALSLSYTEVNPQKAVLTTDGLTDSLFATGVDLPSGSDVVAAFNFAVINPADRLYTLRAAMRDSAGNRTTISTKVGLDGTAPQNCLASAPTISAERDFTVSWSAGSDGAGSGIAAYDIYSRAGEGAWQLWFTATAAGEKLFSGQDGVEYRFEAVARDFVGLAEAFSADGEAKVLVDLTANDKEAPPPPINLLANGSSPSPWANNSRFTITWIKPEDESGVVASYWKLGAAPVSNTDTSGIGGSGPAEGSMIVTMQSSGKQRLYVWLVDARGNVDYRNAGAVLLRNDIDSPRIVATRFPAPGYGEDWFNPETASSATFEVTYHEQYAASFQLKSTDYNYSIAETSLQSGIGVKKTVALDLTGRTKTTGALFISIADSAGNVGESVDTLRLDSTPPYGSLAASPAVSAATSFQVSWTAGEDAGVGVSNTFDVYVKVNQDGWTRWLDDHVGRSAIYQNAQDGNNYHFEAVARDWLGNEETRTYAHESTTTVNTALGDSLAPGAPLDLRANGANPSPWRPTADFSITWRAPDDQTGTPKAYYKLGDKPTGNADTTASFIGQPPLAVNATKENGQALHLWLQDGAQNVDYRNNASVLLRFDKTPAKIDSLVLNPRPAFTEKNTHWYNPLVPPHGTSLYVYFQERHAASVLLEPSSLFESGGVIPGEGVDSARFQLDFAGFEDNIVTLNVTVADSAGNKTAATTMLGLDSTAPQNTRAQSPDTTKPGDFIVSWDVSEVIEQGAGLSGIFDVRVKVDDGAWELWQARYEGTSVLYNGATDHTYAFEVAAYDNVGNKENFTGSAESVTRVVTQFTDTVAPAAPTNITINGFAAPRWSRSSDFIVRWISPTDPSGIARIYYKFQTPPAAADDYHGAAGGNPPITLQYDREGATTVYFWLQDGAGNSDFHKNGQSIIKYDGTAPTIVNSIVANALHENKWLNPDSTTSAQIRITYSENYPDSMRLLLGGAQVNEPPTELGGGENQEIDFIISIAEVNDGCYSLAAILSDSAGNVATDSFYICLDSAPPSGATASSPEQSVSNKFTVSWGGESGGDDGDGSGLSGEYDLRMRIGDGEWFDVFERTETTSYNYIGAHHNTFAFEVAAWDNVGNRELFTGAPETVTIVDTAFVDVTPPPIPLALVVRGKNPSPWQNHPDFTLEWHNPVDPSGIQVAYFKLDAMPASPTDFTDSVAVETDVGRALLNISKEDGQICHVWLKDGRGNADFTKTASILLRYDATPPIISSMKTVNSGEMSNRFNHREKNDIFIDIVFAEAHVDSLYLISDSLGQKRIKVSAQNILSDTLKASFNVKDAADGQYRMYAALSDSAGNVSQRDSIDIVLDSHAPRVVHTPTDSVVIARTAVAVQAIVTDENELQNVELWYWPGGARQKLPIPMIKMNDSTFSAEIPAAAVGDRGVEYLIVADDGVNQNRYPLAERKSPLALRVQLDDGLVMPQTLRAGSDENAYQMVAFPLDIRQPGASLLEDELGAYDATMWRFFRWNPVDLLFNEYPAMGDLRHGQAYWLITIKPDVKLDTGAGITVSTIKPYTIVLKQGWNDIGVPFNFPIDWDDVITSSAIDTQKVQGPHAYDGRWVYPFENKVLQPWTGYSIYSDVDDISIVVPALEAQRQLAKSRPFAGGDMEWACEITAQSNDMVDAANYFGCCKAATDEWDYGLDFVEAPGMGSYLSLYFEHEKWGLKAARFTTDFRPPKKGHVWEFQLASNKTEHEIRLSFRPVAPLPKSLELRLIDEEASVNVDLRADSTYTFRFARKEDVRHFRIYAGDPEFMQSQSDALAELPRQTEPVRNFPNPFNSSTVISYELTQSTDVELAVYNLLAQKVRQLRSGYQEKGFYQVSWDAHDDNGRQLGTGVYILRLETAALTYTCKMVYMR
ncbi:VCBS repeat-containing protein [candidate division KSB1 bacterium]|nr:VCBS repeat-containing protein [candidate division KSB1 bacterium]